MLIKIKNKILVALLATILFSTQIQITASPPKFNPLNNKKQTTETALEEESCSDSAHPDGEVDVNCSDIIDFDPGVDELVIVLTAMFYFFLSLRNVSIAIFTITKFQNIRYRKIFLFYFNTRKSA